MIQALYRLWPGLLRLATSPLRSIKSICGGTATSRCGATIHLWANLSRRASPWAALDYQALRARGKSHASALRSLGQRWLKILWKIWQTRRSYDPDLHARNQLKHGSWVLTLQSA